MLAVPRGDWKRPVATQFLGEFEVPVDEKGRIFLPAELRRNLVTWKKAMDSLAELWSAGPQAQLSPEEEQRLRSLGYLP